MAIADLLNPALLAVVIAAAASEYERRDGGPMPFELAFWWHRWSYIGRRATSCQPVLTLTWPSGLPPTRFSLQGLGIGRGRWFSLSEKGFVSVCGPER